MGSPVENQPCLQPQHEEHKHHTRRATRLKRNFSMDFRGKGMSLIATLVWLPSLMATPFPGSSDNDVCQYTCLDSGACEVLYTGRPRSGNTKGSCFPASFGGRCSGTPPECQDCNKVKNCEKSLEPRGQPLCECINPFVGTRNAYRGNPESLCGSGGPGFCYVPCNADCSDIQLTSSASRCQSANACDVQQNQNQNQNRFYPEPEPEQDSCPANGRYPNTDVFCVNEDGSTNCQQDSDCPEEGDTCEDDPQGKVCYSLQFQTPDESYLCFVNKKRYGSWEACLEDCRAEECIQEATAFGAENVKKTSSITGQSYSGLRGVGRISRRCPASRPCPYRGGRCGRLVGLGRGGRIPACPRRRF